MWHFKILPGAACTSEVEAMPPSRTEAGQSHVLVTLQQQVAGLRGNLTQSDVARLGCMNQKESRPSVSSCTKTTLISDAGNP